MKTIDPTIDLVRKVYSKPVPLQSELTNPFNANKRRKTKSTEIKVDEFPDDINKWDNRTFSKYFGEQYKIHVGGFYKITFTSDNQIMQSILDFMEDNKLSKKEHAKLFLDWCFANKDVIISSQSYFLPTTIRNFLNKYYQDQIRQNDDTTPLIDIFSEIEELYANGRQREIYSKYGIPVASTYFINKKNFDYENVKINLFTLFETLAEGNIEQKRLLGDIFQKSIARSPYLNSMYLLDWRDTFSSLADKYKKESWWKDDDYLGKPRFDYDKIAK